jgi:bacillithiol system protein YtxJ
MWKHISSESDLDIVLNDESNLNPVVLFKHSTRCPVSFTAKKMFEFGWDNSFDAYLIDLIAHRNVSNKISSELNIQHESPQLLVVSKNKVVYDASHGSIDAQVVIDFIRKL